jgi:hypothetical protein
MDMEPVKPSYGRKHLPQVHLNPNPNLTLFPIYRSLSYLTLSWSLSLPLSLSRAILWINLSLSVKELPERGSEDREDDNPGVMLHLRQGIFV